MFVPFTDGLHNHVQNPTARSDDILTHAAYHGHQRTVHSGFRPGRCPVEGCTNTTVLAHSNGLSSHHRLHHTELLAADALKAYSARQCPVVTYRYRTRPKAFQLRRNLARHLQRMHETDPNFLEFIEQYN